MTTAAMIRIRDEVVIALIPIVAEDKHLSG